MNISLATWFRWLELTAELLFLSSTSVVLVGLVTVAPQFFPLAHVGFPLALSYVAMRRGWRMAAIEGVLTLLMVALYPNGFHFWPYYIMVATPVAIATAWSAKTRKRAAHRWWATMTAVVSGDIAWAAWSTGHVFMTLRIWAMQPAVDWAAKFPNTLSLVAMRHFWPMGSVGEIFASATAIFGFVSFLGQLAPLSIPRVSRFGNWRMSTVWLIVAAAMLLLLVIQAVYHQESRWTIMGCICLWAAYSVLGASVLWSAGHALAIHPAWRVAFLFLIPLASWVGFLGLAALGLFDSLWQWRQKWSHEGKPS